MLHFSATSFIFHRTNYAKPLSASVLNIITQAALQELYLKSHELDQRIKRICKPEQTSDS